MGQLGKIKRSLSVDARWNTWASFVVPLAIIALVTTMLLWLAADEFGATVSSRWQQRDNRTAMLRLLFRN
jgi:hypothetical protein